MDKLMNDSKRSGWRHEAGLQMASILVPLCLSVRLRPGFVPVNPGPGLLFIFSFTPHLFPKQPPPLTRKGPDQTGPFHFLGSSPFNSAILELNHSESVKSIPLILCIEELIFAGFEDNLHFNNKVTALMKFECDFFERSEMLLLFLTKCRKLSKKERSCSE